MIFSNEKIRLNDIILDEFKYNDNIILDKEKINDKFIIEVENNVLKKLNESIMLTDSDGKFHCDDGPAVIYPNGLVMYFNHGIRHRLDGPAVFYLKGDKKTKYFVNGIECLSTNQYEQEVLKFKLSSFIE